MQTTIALVIEFLTELHLDKNLSYSAINSARSALSSFVVIEGHMSVGSHPLVCRFMKGIFNRAPPKPRYTKIWDASIVLNYLRKLGPARKLGLRDITLKTCMLVALLSAQRQQTLKFLQVDQMEIGTDSIIFHVDRLLKQSRPGNVGKTIELKAYPTEKRLCVYTYIIKYLEATQQLRQGEKQLFISYKKPHAKVTTDTIARWIKTIMVKSGVDTDMFKPHSTRSASTSKANMSTSVLVPVSEIMAMAGWSKEGTFAKFYNKPVCKNANLENRFARAVLS